MSPFAAMTPSITLRDGIEAIIKRDQRSIELGDHTHWDIARTSNKKGWCSPSTLCLVFITQRAHPTVRSQTARCAALLTNSAAVVLGKFNQRMNAWVI